MPSSRSSWSLLALGPFALACGWSAAPSDPSSPASSAVPAESVQTARIEGLQAQIDAISGKPESFDLWVSNAMTLNGAPVPQDLGMAILVDRLLAKGLFPHGFSEGAGGRTYHFRRGPAGPAVPPAGEPRLVPRDLRAGRAYKIHVEHNLIGGSSTMSVDATATVTSIGDDAVDLDVRVEHGTEHPAERVIFSDVKLRLSVPKDAGDPRPQRADGLPFPVEFLDPRPDDDTRATLPGLLNTFSFERCLLPRQAHATGEKWTETRALRFFGDVAIAWEAGPVVVHAGGAFATYTALWRMSTAKNAPPTLAIFEVKLSVHLDDGFHGDCVVHDFMLGPDNPSFMTRISSTPVRG
ncbi:hypothetical protein [Nannocystis punicea]|uniref:Uncharacterized protein n=1 Tax=Nannocystis punicea TaxID=2995304 RepID=A0ABY7HCE2_9BACT|nr:hypothetical protein [Nannocystis poenicansa]WAS96953.1 hypothetical protein O0S08_12455 [Nannocystis poenicansa]